MNTDFRHGVAGDNSGGISLDQVYVFISTGRFRSLTEMRGFIDETYTKGGDGVPSPFMREVGLSEYEPACIEALHEDKPTSLAELLAGASYHEQWLQKLDGKRRADSTICVFAP